MQRFKFLLLLVFVSLSACTTKKAGYEDTFEHLWDEMDATYGSFEVRDVDWDDVYERYRPLVSDDMSEDEFYEVITDMLAETDDGHVHVLAPERQIWSANHFYREKIGFDEFDVDVVRAEYLGGKYDTNDEDFYTLGELEDGSTYLHLRGIDDSALIMNKAREKADDSGRLILDLRHNGGGDMTWAFLALQEWTSKDLVVSYNRTRNGPGRSDFTGWYTSKIEGKGRDISFPVVVLIDRFTISAGERLVLALDRLEGVTFLGAPTNGSVATSVGKEMRNGWFFTNPTQEVMNPDRATTIEGEGFMPDFFVQNDPSEVADGHDAVLEAAMAALE